MKTIIYLTHIRDVQKYVELLHHVVGAEHVHRFDGTCTPDARFETAHRFREDSHGVLVATIAAAASTPVKFGVVDHVVLARECRLLSFQGAEICQALCRPDVVIDDSVFLACAATEDLRATVERARVARAVQ